MGGTLSPETQQFLNQLAEQYQSTEIVGMAGPVQTLERGQIMIGFMKQDGSLVGPLVDIRSIGHDALADMYAIRGAIKAGAVIPITVSKSMAGNVNAFGSGTFGNRLTPSQKAIAPLNVN